MVTSTTWHRDPSRNISKISSACRRTAPLVTESEMACGVLNIVMACPAAGPSTTMTSAAAVCSRCLTLPNTNRSSMPGAAEDTTSSTPEVTMRREMRPSPLVSRYSRRAAAGVKERLETPEGTGFPSVSTKRLVRPQRCAARARAAATVDFPTPPFPATMKTRDAVKN